ncbi:TetR/AcrR family transcriptional regulator [Actinomadura yumaensis]|uniref:TetR/AcrR family transcriptional regulator n=1 Tax=Actinomadura yumaensis TaxID=111807 RepID=UPI003607C9F1
MVEKPGLRAAAAERTRRAIVAAARRHLVESGYAGFGMERVAEEAGVTRVTIYRRFGSKLGLLEAVADDLAARSRVVPLLADAEAGDAAAAFRAMVSGLCAFWGTDPDLFRRLISLAAVDPEAQELLGSRERWRYGRITAFVERLAAAGRVRAPFDALGAAAVVGAVTSFPACDEMAARLGVGFAELDGPLTALLASVADLDARGGADGGGTDGGGGRARRAERQRTVVHVVKNGDVPWCDPPG